MCTCLIWKATFLIRPDLLTTAYCIHSLAVLMHLNCRVAKVMATLSGQSNVIVHCLYRCTCQCKVLHSSTTFVCYKVLDIFDVFVFSLSDQRVVHKSAWHILVHDLWHTQLVGSYGVVLLDQEWFPLIKKNQIISKKYQICLTFCSSQCVVFFTPGTFGTSRIVDALGLVHKCIHENDSACMPDSEQKIFTNAIQRESTPSRVFRSPNWSI